VCERYDYPHHELDADVWWYYMFSLAFYWSLSISQFFDVKRKDFVEMFIHHITTIALLAFSWTCNLFR
jgi:ceramide synthetase